MMRKYFFIFAALLFIASCGKQNVPVEDDPNTLTINALLPGNTATSAKAALVEISSEGASAVMLSEETIGSGESMQFKFKFENEPKQAPLTYATVYPSTAVSASEAEVSLSVPAYQTYTTSSADETAAVYYEVSQPQPSRPTKLDLSYTGLSGLMKLNFTSLPSDETILNVAVTSVSGNLAGKKTLNLATGELSSLTSTSATINAALEKGAQPTSIVHIRTLPISAGKYNITLVTNKNIFKWNEFSIGDIVPGHDADVKLDVSTAKKQNELNILLIGNSFTQDACHQLPALLCGFAPKIGPNGFKVTLCQMYYGGRTVQGFNEGWTSSDYTQHVAKPGESKMTDTKNQNLRAVAKSGRWDIVTIQEYTGSFLAWDWNDAAKKNFEELIEKVIATQEVRPQLYYVFSQTYYDMGKIGTGSSKRITWQDQNGMFNVLATFGKHVMEELPFVDVIPTGTMLQNLRQTSLMNSLGLSRDGYHMDYGLPRYGAACCCYMQMIYPRCGEIPLSVNTYRSNEADYSTGTYRTPITDDNVPIAQQAALDAIASPWTVTYFTHEYGSEGSAGKDPGTVNQGSLQ